MTAKKILLLDPSPDGVNYFRNVIVPEIPFAAVLIVASKTQTAVDLLENNDFDIIISQIFPMTIVNGLSIVARMRNGDFGQINKEALAIACAPAGFDITMTVDAGFDTQLKSDGDDVKRWIGIFRRYGPIVNKRNVVRSTQN